MCVVLEAQKYKQFAISVVWHFDLTHLYLEAKIIPFIEWHNFFKMHF